MPLSKTPRAILLIFCLLLLLPLAGQWLKLAPAPANSENRKLTERPQLSWSVPALQKFPREYQAYYNDNFGFRKILVRGNYLLHYGLLGVSPSSQVLVGRNGWLYYTGEHELDDYRGITRFHEDQLQKWAEALLLKRNWLRQKGIRYLLVIAPNKSTIYPEFLPDGYGRVRQGSGLDDFLSYVRRHTDLDVVDLRQSLLADKEKHELYLRTDTHWNDYGAFLGYRELVRPLAAWYPSIIPLELGDFSISWKAHYAGDLAKMMGAREDRSDAGYFFTAKRPPQAIVSEKGEKPRDPFTVEKKVAGLPRAVIFRDSFFTGMIPFVAEHFSSSRYIWSRWDSQIPMEDILASYHPQIVIEEEVERIIKNDYNVFAGGIPSYFNSALAAQAILLGKGEEIDLKTVTAQNRTVLEAAAGGLLVKASDRDPQLLLPASKTLGSSKEGIVLRVSIESPNETRMQLYYKTIKEPDYSESKSAIVVLHKGLNKVDLLIKKQDIVGPLRLDPAEMTGQYLLRKLVIYPISGRKV
jgi:alginate O-acetyltransferase complex protein AlgJ